MSTTPRRKGGGEVRKAGNPIVAGNNNSIGPADLVPSRDEIHESRKLRDEERGEPIVTNDSITEICAEGAHSPNSQRLV